MFLTVEQLEQTEQLASLLMSPDEITIILAVDKDEFLDELLYESTDAYKAHQRGKLRTKAELHKTILTQAKQGSGPAQSMAARILLDLESREL